MSGNLSSAAAMDTNLYSRQIGVLGAETMTRLMRLRVFILGLQGTGVEIAKNLVLAGVNRVTICDDTPVEEQDLGSNCFLQPAHVGTMTRAQAVIGPLRQLNQYVHVCVHSGDVTPAVLSGSDICVLCNVQQTRAIQINKYCRSQQPEIGFINVGVFGLAASIFVDFGSFFTVSDPVGTPMDSCMIEGFTACAGDSLLTNVLCYTPNGRKSVPFEIGYWVCFSELPEELLTGGVQDNSAPGGRRFKVVAVAKNQFTIAMPFSPQLSATGENGVRGGVATEVRVPQVRRYRPLAESCKNPLAADSATDFIAPDLGRPESPKQLHFIIQALLNYELRNGNMPEARDEKAVEEVYAIAQRLLPKACSAMVDGTAGSPADTDESGLSVAEIDKELLKRVVDFACCHIAPMASYAGGIVAQEVVKFTGKYSPIHQWLYLDATDILDVLPKYSPAAATSPAAAAAAAAGAGAALTRYEDQISIWGPDFQRKLENLKCFMVGAGALGCEYLKLMALMGVCCGEQGSLTVTDMDRIEVSNLNRQFLFHREHVGLPKSQCAADAVRTMNQAMKLTALELKVAEETEDTFNYAFWDAQNAVVNALDNVPSRMYVDGLCVLHNKPLVEAGTLGTKANIQIVVPKLTESYSDATDPPEESIPLCTLRHFPNQIEHTIEWARDWFEEVFTQLPQDANLMMTQSTQFFTSLKQQQSPKTQLEKLQLLEKLFNVAEAPDMQTKMREAVQLLCLWFETRFNHDLQQLLFNFPVDHVGSGGVPFWGGPKRPPTPLEFDVDEAQTAEFVVSGTRLILQVVGSGLQPPLKDFVDQVKAVAKQHFKLSPFVPNSSLVIRTDEQEDGASQSPADRATAGSGIDTDFVTARDALGQKFAARPSRLTFNSLAFEKDDETNGHIDFISSAANLRARNYKIEECDKLKCRLIAGKIIPALATTTAMITGLAMFELIKVIATEGLERKIENYRNSFIDIATCTYIMSEPVPPPRNKSKDYDPVVGGPVRCRPENFTSWDSAKLSMKTPTLQDLVTSIEKTYDCEVNILSAGNLCLYNSFSPPSKKRLPVQIQSIIQAISKKPTVLTNLIIQACCTDREDGVDLNIPTIDLCITQ